MYHLLGGANHQFIRTYASNLTLMNEADWMSSTMQLKGQVKDGNGNGLGWGLIVYLVSDLI